MLMQEGGPLCRTGQEGRPHLQLPLLLPAQMKPHVAIGVRAVPVVIWVIHVQGWDQARVCCVFVQSARTGRRSQRLSFGEGFSRAAGHGMAPVAGLPREAEQRVHSRPCTVLVVWVGEYPHCFLTLCAFWCRREETLTHCVGFVLQTFCYGYTWLV